MIYLVSIQNQGLESASPSDGFIDPTTVSQYHSVIKLTGSKAVSGLEAGLSFYLNNVVITTTGTTLVSLINDINYKANLHRCHADEDSGKLVISNLPMYDGSPYINDISENISDKLGFVNPVKDAPIALPTTKDQAVAKVRANVRWDMVLESLQLTSNIGVTFVSKATGASPVMFASSVDFLLTIPENYHSYDFSGKIVYGPDAIKFAIAKSLMYSARRYCTFFDPTFTDPDNKRQMGDVLELVEVGALTSDTDVAYDAIKIVTQ